MYDKEEKRRDFRIILLSSSKFKNDKMIPVSMNFLKNHAYVACHYNKIKIQNPSRMYFYTIINKGGAKKYKLIDIIYSTCVYAYFTEETVEKIKLYRDAVKKR